jgi:hypothetical protein
MSRLPTRHELALARSEVEAAERALTVAMGLLEVAPRADKVSISEALEQALERLRCAQSELLSMEALATDP